jgi:two-component system alkaline phosphatase synthesis response regulator PhoP
MGKKKILVVDDEVDFLEVIRLRLEANGYDVITAFNGNEALEKIKDEKVDAVFLDILMPGIDGLETLRRIRKINENLPVYIITAFSTEERFKSADKFGASGFIVKTDDLDKQIKSITSALGLADKYQKNK